MSRQVSLRAIEPSDVQFLYEIENNQNFWEVSNTRIPFSMHTLKMYAETPQDIYRDRQLRLVVLLGDKPVGFVDFFEYEPFHKRAGLGVVISEGYQGKGLGTTALKQALVYAYKHIGILTLQALILENNEASIKAFSKVGFKEVGKLHKWHCTEDGDRLDMLIFQENLE